jgi:acyl carrier protein
MVKCRPPQNRDPKPEEQEACIQWLREQTRLIRPKIIVCLGRISAQRLIDKDFRVTKQHGQFIEKGGILFMGTFHPAALLRNPNQKPQALEDFVALREKILEFQYKAMNQYRIAGIHFVDEIPVTSIGKPKRYLLKEYVLSGAETAAAEEEKINEEPAPAEDPAAPSHNADWGSVDPAEVEREVFRIVKNISKYEREITGLEDFKNDLGMDSLSIMEMCTEIESMYSVSVGAYFTAIPNARELTDYILDPIFEGLAASGKNPRSASTHCRRSGPTAWTWILSQRRSPSCARNDGRVSFQAAGCYRWREGCRNYRRCGRCASVVFPCGDRTRR